MFDEIAAQLRSTFDEMRYGTATRTITVAKPYCSPARDCVMTALKPYGVRVFDYHEAARMANPLAVLRMTAKIAGDVGLTVPNALPIAQVAHVTVSEAAAAWAEYLLLRTGKLYRVGPYVNRRNEAWAARHGGRMPPAWGEGKPWIERSCTEGVNAWQQIRETAKEAQMPVNERQSGHKFTRKRKL